MNLSTLLIFLATAIGGGSTVPLIKLVVSEFTPIPQVFLRAFLAGIIILPFFLKKNKTFSKRNLITLIFASILAAANPLLFAFGIQYTSVIMGQIIYVPTALIVAVLGTIFLKEKLTRNQLIGLVFSLIGVSILIYSSFRTKDILSFGTPLGNILIIIALICWSSYVVVSRRLSKFYSPLEITFFNFLVTASVSFVLLPFALTNFDLGKITQGGIIALASLTIFSTVLFFYFYQIIIKRTSAFISALIFYLNSIIAGAVGVIFYHEKLTSSLVVGAILIIIGVIAATYKKRK